MDPETEETVPDALIRWVLHAAWDAVPSPDAWNRLATRLDTGQAGADAPRRRKASAVRSGPVPAFPHFPGGADCRRGPHRALDPHLPRADQRARLNSAPTSSRHSERSEESR